MEDREARDQVELLARELIRKHNLRVRQHTAQYLRARAARNELSDLPVIGSDARTGVPVRVILPAAEVASLWNPDNAY